jgi:prevent-host-death family protein
MVRMVMKSSSSSVQYFRAPNEDEEIEGPFSEFPAFGGGARGSEAAMPHTPEHLLRSLLDSTVAMPESANALGELLTDRVNEVVGTAFRRQGRDVHARPQAAVVELSYDKARSRLAGLMADVRKRLVATITKRGAVEDAVVLMDWRALDLVLGLAEKQLKRGQPFGDLVTESVGPETAAAIAALDIHRPLTHRQTPAERREVRKALARETE